MLAAILKAPNERLSLERIEKPTCQDHEILIKVSVSAICRTDLHIIDGEVLAPKYPIIPGHQVVGRVVSVGKNVKRFQEGDRVGAFWLGSTCGACSFCENGQENLCDLAEFTGLHRNGGFAEYMCCHADFALFLPEHIEDEKLAPLLCAGVIGYRSYQKALPAERIGFYGFGSAAHLLIQLALKENKEIYAFTREGDKEALQFAKKMGAIWAGASGNLPPNLLDSAILFAPVGATVPQSLKALRKGGKCICGGIHMSDIPSFPYQDLWGEKRIESVANVTREDAVNFFSALEKITIEPSIKLYSLQEVNQAIEDLRSGNFTGSLVLDLRDKNRDSSKALQGRSS